MRVQMVEIKKKILFFLRYLSPYKQQLIQLFLGMLVVSLLQLIFPFLTHSLVDIGIQSFIALKLIVSNFINIS